MKCEQADHKFEMGDFDVCARCGGEKPQGVRGFAAMPRDKRMAIAKRGGGSVPGEKRSFAKNRELAASAGSKGGAATHRNRPPE